jgi:hypothetical protein
LALQTTIDTGWIGLAVLLWFLVVVFDGALRNIEIDRSAESIALVSGLAAVVLVGATEALPGVPGIYLMASFIMFGCASLSTFRIPHSTVEDTAPAVNSVDSPRYSQYPREQLQLDLLQEK